MIFRLAELIWAHPANRRHRITALANALIWQLRKRLIRSPIDIAYAGLKIRCYPDSHDASRIIYFNGMPDPKEMQFLKDYLRPGDNVIDAGANIGVYTLLMSAIVEPGQVIAFEPDHKCAERLRENVKINQLSNVVVREAAISDFSGTALFSVGEDTAGSFANLKSAAETNEVEVIRLDDEMHDRVALCKLDVEGAETAVLRGAEESLRSHNPPVWIVELTRRTLNRSGTALEDVISLLNGHGFELWTYDPQARDLAEWTERPRKPGHVGDVIAVATSHLDEVRKRLADEGRIS